jgi:hypothetical protein
MDYDKRNRELLALLVPNFREPTEQHSQGHYLSRLLGSPKRAGRQFLTTILFRCKKLF